MAANEPDSIILHIHRMKPGGSGGEKVAAELRLSEDFFDRLVAFIECHFRLRGRTGAEDVARRRAAHRLRRRGTREVSI